MHLHETHPSLVLTNCSDVSGLVAFIYVLSGRQLLQNSVFSGTVQWTLLKGCLWYVRFFFLFLPLLRYIFLISVFHVQLIVYFYTFEVCLWKLDYWKFVSWPIYPLNPILHLRCSWKYQPRASAGQSTSHCESRSQTSNHTSAHQRGTSGHQCNTCSSKCL